MKITLLSDEVINQIAAGEVIENPASVVKELIENAIDAKSRRISVEIQAGGQQLIRVTDDGQGMSRLDAEACLQRHATSKIKCLADLDTLDTRGFRGEALAAIASVSKMELTTSNGMEGTRLLATGGKIDTIETCARNQGVTVTIQSLFYNTPARRKFQKSVQANSSQIARMVETLALAEPSIAFTLHSQGHRVFHFEAAGWKQRIEEVLSHEVCQDGFWIEEATVNGWLGSPSQTRANRAGQRFFINRRPIMSPLISRAIQEGYGTRIAGASFPEAVLFLAYPSHEFDVNVHPQKREVRFCQEGKLFASIRDAICRVFRPTESFTETISFPAAHLTHRSLPWESEPCREKDAQLQIPLPEIRSGRVLALVGKFLLIARHEGVFVAHLSEINPNESLKQEGVQSLMVPITLDVNQDEVHHIPEIVQRCHELGIESRQVGPRSISWDALPIWINRDDADVLFRIICEDLRQDLSAHTTLCRFIKSPEKRITLQEAEYLWSRGCLSEYRIESDDLERVVMRGKK